MNIVERKSRWEERRAHVSQFKVGEDVQCHQLMKTKFAPGKVSQITKGMIYKVVSVNPNGYLKIINDHGKKLFYDSRAFRRLIA